MAKRTAPTNQDYLYKAKVYRAFAHPKRIEIVDLLLHREMFVDDLADILRIKKSNVSQHLQVLRQIGTVSSRREGHHVYYFISTKSIAQILRMLNDLWARGGIPHG